MKRIMSAVLSVALVFGLAVMPVGAAGGKVTVTCPKEKSIPELETTGYGEALFINGRLNVHNKKTDLYGYIDTDGRLVIPCIYKVANPFQNGVAIVQKDGLFGLIATDGKAIVAPQYSAMKWADDDILCFESADGAKGYLGLDGKVLAKVEGYHHLGSFVDGVALWQKQEQVYRVSRTDMKPAPAFTLADSIVLESNATNYNNFSAPKTPISYYKVNKGTGYGPFGVIDANGKSVLPAIYDSVELMGKDFVSAEKEGTTALYRLSDGKELISMKNSQHFTVSENFIHLSTNIDGVSHTALYNLEGKLVFGQPGQSTGIHASDYEKDPFVNIGEYKIGADGSVSDQKWYVIDTTGKKVWENGNVELPFSENGVTIASTEEPNEDGIKVTQDYVIDKNWNKLVKISGAFAGGPFSEGYCIGRISGREQHFAYLNESGAVVWESDVNLPNSYNGMEYRAHPVHNGYAFVKLGDGYEVLKFPKNAKPSLENFEKTDTYAPNQLKDVAEGQWYSAGIKAAYELGLMKGVSADKFDLNGKITVGAAITTAARIHSIYNTGTAEFAKGNPWYKPYVDYALKNGIIDKGFDSYTRPATRGEFAAILAGALPDSAMKAKNSVADDILPDVKLADPNGAAIYRLYRAGILTGNDKQGTFTPNASIGRNAAATIVARMAQLALRANITLN